MGFFLFRCGLHEWLLPPPASIHLFSHDIYVAKKVMLVLRSDSTTPYVNDLVAAQGSNYVARCIFWPTRLKVYPLGIAFISCKVYPFLER